VAPRVEVSTRRSPRDGEFDFEKIYSSPVGLIARQ
jgi:hypothetical protein